MPDPAVAHSGLPIRSLARLCTAAALLAALLAHLGIGAARAADPDATVADRRLCGGDAAGQARIDACARLLAAPALAPSERARILADRAAAENATDAPDAALADLDEAIRLDPAQPDIFVRRAELRLSSDDAEGALSDYGRAIALKPDDLAALRGRVNLLMKQGRDEDVLRDLDAIIGADPGDGPAYDDRALARWRMLHRRDPSTGGERSFAALQHEVCLELHSDCGDVALVMADLDKAVALTSGPQRAVALIDRADVLAEQGRFPQALSDDDAAIELRPDAVPYRLHRASLRWHAGDLGGARADLDEALRLRPDDPLILLQRGKLRRQVGDLEGARTDLDAAIGQAGPVLSTAWEDEAHRLRREIAKPGEPGFEPELRDLTVDSVTATRDPSGQEIVTIGFAPEGARRLAAFTAAHVGSRTEMLLDGSVITAPRILAPITGGSLMLSGSFTADQAEGLAARLRTPGAMLAIRALD